MNITPRQLLKQSTIRRPARAVTLMELLIALSITAVTCGILAVLINATAVGTSTQNDGRRSLTRLQAIKAMLEDEFINTRCVLAVGNNYIVYWIGDQPGAVTTANGAVNFTELRLLEIDSTGSLVIHACKWPTGMSAAAIQSNDTTYAANSNWYSLASGLKGTTYYNRNVIATGATSLNTTLDAPAATSARLVQLRIGVTESGTARQVVMGTKLTNPGVPW